MVGGGRKKGKHGDVFKAANLSSVSGTVSI